SPLQLTDMASDRLVNRRAVLVVDEAQFLEPLALEQLRALHDAIQLGVALSGNPTVLTQIHGGARRAEFAQLSRRVSMTHVYERPYPEDVEILCNAWGVTHPKQREFLTKLAMAPGEGGVGTLTQTLK